MAAIGKVIVFPRGQGGQFRTSMVIIGVLSERTCRKAKIQMITLIGSTLANLWIHQELFLQRRLTTFLSCSAIIRSMAS